MTHLKPTQMSQESTRNNKVQPIEILLHLKHVLHMYMY